MPADLAARLAESQGFRWQEGMLAEEGGRSGLHGARGRIVPGATHDGWSVAWRIDSGVLTTSITHGAVPVLSDPASAGCLLAMLDGYSVSRCHRDAGDLYRVVVSVPGERGRRRVFAGPSLGSACAAALLACWGPGFAAPEAAKRRGEEA